MEDAKKAREEKILQIIGIAGLIAVILLAVLILSRAPLLSKFDFRIKIAEWLFPFSFLVWIILSFVYDLCLIFKEENPLLGFFTVMPIVICMFLATYAAVPVKPLKLELALWEKNAILACLLIIFSVDTIPAFAMATKWFKEPPYLWW